MLSRNTPRLTLAAFLAVLVFGGAGLLLAGLTQRRGTVLAAEVQATSIVAVLGPGGLVCQGPVTPAHPVRTLTLWTERRLFPDTLTALIRQGPGNRLVARAPLAFDHSLPAVPYGSAAQARLPRTLPGEKPYRLCVRADADVNILGASASTSSGQLRIGGRESGLAMAFVFGSPHPGTVLGELSSIVERAALFRPGWVGAWTFWALAALFIAAIGLLARGLMSAAAQDNEDDSSDESY
jgi:hypothetical protein